VEEAISPWGTLAGQGPAMVEGRVLALDPTLAGLFPDRGLRRGSVLGVSGGHGSTSLLLALLTRALATGSWAALVGLPAVGVEAAVGLGLSLEHLALVPHPGARWTEVVGALLDTVDIVVVGPLGGCRAADARRLAARARERDALLVVATPGAGGGSRSSRWPEAVDLTLEATAVHWHGLGRGEGTLARREVWVRSSGRRGGARERTAHLWLPGPDGELLSAGSAHHSVDAGCEVIGPEPATGVRAG
jgi:hypothetical protein